MALEADVLTVELADGPARFHAVWLRDNARDDASRDAANDQRLFDVSELPDEVAIAAAEVVDGHLRVEFAPDGAVSTFDVEWLEAHRYDGRECRSPVPGWRRVSTRIAWRGHDKTIRVPGRRLPRRSYVTAWPSSTALPVAPMLWVRPSPTSPESGARSGRPTTARYSTSGPRPIR